MTEDPHSREFREYIQTLATGDTLPEEVKTSLEDLSADELQKRTRLWHLLRVLPSVTEEEAASRSAAARDAPEASSTHGSPGSLSDDEAWTQLRARIREHKDRKCSNRPSFSSQNDGAPEDRLLHKER